MSLEIAVTFFFAIFIFAITPGPGTFALLARAISSGSVACISMIFGIVFSDLIYLILSIFGLSSIAENYGTLFTMIRFAGAAYLFYLGWKMWTAEVDTNFESGKQSKRGWIGGFIQGFLISASNPKVILFYIAFLPTFIDLTKLEKNDIFLVTGLTFLGLVAGLMLVAVGASSVRAYLKSKKAVRRLNRTAGGIMIGAGAFLVYSGSRN